MNRLKIDIQLIKNAMFFNFLDDISNDLAKTEWFEMSKTWRYLLMLTYFEESCCDKRVQQHYHFMGINVSVLKDHPILYLFEPKEEADHSICQVSMLTFDAFETYINELLPIYTSANFYFCRPIS